MQRLHPPKDYTNNFIFVVCILMILLASAAVYSALLYCKMTKQLEYTHGKKIDLPEELSTVGKTPVLMEATSDSTTIYIYFKH